MLLSKSVVDQNPIGCDLWVSSTSTVIPSYFYDSMITGADDGDFYLLLLRK